MVGNYCNFFWVIYQIARTTTAHWHLGDVLVGNHLFVIFEVLDVSCAVNSCINHSFYIYAIGNYGSASVYEIKISSQN